MIVQPCAVHSAFNNTPEKTKLKAETPVTATSLTVHQKGPVAKDKYDQQDDNEPLLRPHSHAGEPSGTRSYRGDCTHVLSDKLMLAIPMAMLPMTYRQQVNSLIFMSSREGLPG